MFAVNCPYCRHVNKRGARYCADCGAALHLKPCAKCGKVDEVTATKCANCGTAFPAIELADYRADLEPIPSKANGGEAKGGVGAGKTSPQALRAGPLIVIAVVAGGLPFLWMNRDRLPTPGELQVPLGNRLAVPPPQVPSTTPATAPTITSTVPPGTPVISGTTVDPAPATPAAVGNVGHGVDDRAPKTTASQAQEAVRNRLTTASGEHRVKPGKVERRPTKQQLQEPAETSQPPHSTGATRECSESLAALGLCGTERSSR